MTAQLSRERLVKYSPITGDKIIIRFIDRSKSQCFRCKFAWSDGLNTVFYCEEGLPLLTGANSYEVIKEGWK